jgi:hypothetical protein
MRGVVENAKEVKATTTTSLQKNNHKRYAKGEKTKGFVMIVKNQHLKYSCLGIIILIRVTPGSVLHATKRSIITPPKESSKLEKSNMYT